jgi:hypothetical protein
VGGVVFLASGALPRMRAPRPMPPWFARAGTPTAGSIDEAATLICRQRNQRERHLGHNALCAGAFAGGVDAARAGAEDHTSKPR